LKQLTALGELDGKTIAPGGCHLSDRWEPLCLLFTDGSFACFDVCRGYGRGDDSIDICSERPQNASLVSLGLMSQAEYNAIELAEMAAEIQANRARDRKRYEELKAKADRGEI
jgi:hypothetical protein